MPGYRARRRLALLILLIGLPAYIVVAVTLTGWIGSRYGRPPIWAEVGIYVLLGFVWALPFRAIFRGVGREDPDGK